MSQIAFFQHHGASGENVPVQTMLDGIKSGKWAGQIKRLRAAPCGSEEFNNRKRTLPAFMLSATTNAGHKAADVRQHSGLLQLDVDDVGAEHAGNLRDRIGEDRHILAAWISPSGDGVKAIMWIPADLERHRVAFETAADYMRESYGVAIDPKCKDVCRLCFVSHDPDIVTNHDAVELQVSGEVFGASADDNSSESLNSADYDLGSTSYVLGNKAFQDFETLVPLYHRLVTRRYGKPQRGERNASMVEIVASCYCAVSPDHLLAFVSEFYNQHSKIFLDYDYEQWQSEARAMLEGCRQSFPSRLNERECAAYSALCDEQERAAFRICHNLSKCESDATFPPPLFHLSCQQLSTRLGIVKMQAWRILKAFEKSGIIEIVSVGTVRTKGVKGVATVYRWCLAET